MTPAQLFSRIYRHLASEFRSFRHFESLWLVIMMAVAVGARLIPHVPNFTPVLGMALFAGSRFGRRSAGWLAPLVVMALSDLVEGWHVTLPAVYFSVLATIAIADLGQRRGRTGLLARSTEVLASSVFFFVVTNFAVWWLQDLYTPDFSGLIQSWMAALPFYPATIVSTAIYWALLELAHRGLLAQGLNPKPGLLRSRPS